MLSKFNWNLVVHQTIQLKSIRFFSSIYFGIVLFLTIFFDFSPECLPIPVPDGDPFFMSQRCIDFRRSVPADTNVCSVNTVFL